jgi:hypothetical protein
VRGATPRTIEGFGVCGAAPQTSGPFILRALSDLRSPCCCSVLSERGGSGARPLAELVAGSLAFYASEGRRDAERKNAPFDRSGTLPLWEVPYRRFAVPGFGEPKAGLSICAFNASGTAPVKPFCSAGVLRS